MSFVADAWSHDPLGEYTDDRVYGRGATDMKGAVAAMLLAVRAFEEADTVHATDEYTTVDALVGNATIYTRIPGAWTAASTNG